MKLPVLLAFAAALAGPAFAKAWTVDKAASRLGFEATMMGQGFSGEFKAWDAEIFFDPADLAAAKARVTVDMTSAITGDSTRDTALPTADWFDAAAAPQAVFETTAFRKVGDTAYEADGTLTIRGASHPLTLPFTLAIEGDRAEMAATVAIDRTTWGVGQGEWSTGEEVATEVRIVATVKATAAP